MTLIDLHEPEINRASARFSWTIQPASALYKASAFSLHFPDTVDLSAIPRSLWWTIFINCLYTHWLLLRPCRVRLPVRLPEGHLALWKRLMKASQDTMEIYRPEAGGEGPVEIEESGETLPAPTVIPDEGRCATSFSGGKDSLTQTGILCELTQQPLLVTTTSRMEGKDDHVTARRREVFAKIQARKNVRFIEVNSDFRTILNNTFPSGLGYRFATNEISDTFLYAASLVAAGAACGVTHLFMASEAEVQKNFELDGKIIQHKHFMYSSVTQRALDTLIRSSGLRYSSLTSPLHNYPQIQALLWTRYQEISDLQYSCWRLRQDETACSACSACFANALCALYNGGNPRRMGIDLTRLFNAKKDWKPRAPYSSNKTHPQQQSPMRKGDLHLLHFIRHIPLRRVLGMIAGRRPPRPMPGELRSSMKAYAGLRKMARTFPDARLTGYRPHFLRQVDPLLREKVASIYASHFESEPESEYLPILQRSDSLAAWICEPVTNASRN